MKTTKLIEPKDNTLVWTKPYYGGIEYEMPKELAKSILATRKGEDQHSNVQKFLCGVVNSEFGIKGYCTKVILT